MFYKFLLKHPTKGISPPIPALAINAAKRAAMDKIGGKFDDWQPWECWKGDECLWHYTETCDCVQGPRPGVEVTGGTLADVARAAIAAVPPGAETYEALRARADATERRLQDALTVIADNIAAWEDEEESVKEEHAELIERSNSEYDRLRRPVTAEG
jgi:hypothetical protein